MWEPGVSSGAAQGRTGGGRFSLPANQDLIGPLLHPFYLLADLIY